MLTVALTFVAAFAFVWAIATTLDRRRRRRRRTAGRGNETAGVSPAAENALASMGSRGFESKVLGAFQAKGYRLVGPPAGSGELVLRRDHETCLVDCRHWREPKVGVRAIETLQAAMRARDSASGFILTRGRFSRDATAAAVAARIRLIDGRTLDGLFDTSTTGGRR